MSLAIFAVLITAWAVVFDILAIPKLVKCQADKEYENFNILNKHTYFYFWYVNFFQLFFIFWKYNFLLNIWFLMKKKLF